MIIPTDLEPFSVEGILKTIAKLSETLGDLEHEVTITGIVPTKVDQRYRMSDAIFNRSLKPLRSGSSIRSGPMPRSKKPSRLVKPFLSTIKAVRPLRIFRN